MGVPFGGPFGAAGRKRSVEFLDGFRELLPVTAGRGDCDAAAIGGLVLTAMHRLTDAGATTAEVNAWLHKMLEGVKEARGIIATFEGV